MANELAIAPTAPPCTTPASTPADSTAGSSDFVAALANVLSTEVSIAATAPITQPVLASEEQLDDMDELLDGSVLAMDPAALMLSIAQGRGSAGSAKSDGGEVPNTVGSKMDPSLLAALSGTTSALATESQAAANTVALLDSASARTESAFDGKADAKPGADNANANVLSANAIAHDRVVDVQDKPVIRAHVGSSTWTQELAGKLTVMIGKGMQSASLQLSPEHLGPLEVRISVQNEQASIWFGAAHAETRAALEQSLPRLRELLAGQGLNLSDAGVFRETPQQQNKQYGKPQTAKGEGEREFTIVTNGLRGMFDAYA